MKIDLGTKEGLAELGQEISRIDEELDESPYERIVVQYPFPLLEVRTGRRELFLKEQDRTYNEGLPPNFLSYKLHVKKKNSFSF